MFAILEKKLAGARADKELKPGINDMLGAFFGPPYRDWWLSYVRNPEFVPPHSNHWLVRKSAAMALARGSVKLDRCQPSMVEVSGHLLIIWGFSV